MTPIDVSPRKVWLGLTIPGKKMMKILRPDAGTQRGQSLIDLYKDAPYQALLSVAIALHTLPDEGARFGPALRDTRRSIQPLMLYGAILTDIRDFLKFRFRCKGLTDDETAPSSALAEGLSTGDLGPALEELETEEAGLAATSYLVSYVVTAFDDLSRDIANWPIFSEEDFANAARRLRDILRAMVRWAYPEWRGGQEHYDRYIGPLFDEHAE